MATGVSIRCRKCLAYGDINFKTDSFKAILMDTGYSFNPDTHLDYGDVSGSELPTGNGYTQDTKTLTGVTLTESTANDRLEVTWGDVSWTATTGSIGPTPGMIIFDDTVTTAGGAETADPIIGYIQFTSEITQQSGGTLYIKNLQFDI